ncbi:hypothetical protein HHI36_002391 [Cryptolaemus montrouzieri]|uniref:Uncharacterized protein n=1 Tax=Cryptolaemus montrouzieri TaxID=559131 RepID=A0ABD2PAV1_9CUCU
MCNKQSPEMMKLKRDNWFLTGTTFFGLNYFEFCFQCNIRNTSAKAYRETPILAVMVGTTSENRLVYLSKAHEICNKAIISHVPLLLLLKGNFEFFIGSLLSKVSISIQLVICICDIQMM